MVYSYYPGCTLKNKAQDLDRYARMSAEALGFTLQEIEEWQCCGAGVSPGLRRDRHEAVRCARFKRREGKGAGSGNPLFRLSSCDQTG